MYNGKFVVDAHTHIFPEKIAYKAVASIGAFYGIDMAHEGLSRYLIDGGERIGVDRYLVCSTATRGDQVVAINNYIAKECAEHPAFYGFGTLHPDFENPEAELERVVELGLHGIKLHPDFQLFHIDDERMIPLYRRMTELGLPVLFHTGDARYPYSQPRRVARVCEKVDGFRCIAAHFGGYSAWDEALDALTDLPNVYFDTSSTLFSLPANRAREMMDKMGYQRFFFGTDFPMWNHEEEWARFQTLQLNDEQETAVLGENFRRFFGI